MNSIRTMFMSLIVTYKIKATFLKCHAKSKGLHSIPFQSTIFAPCASVKSANQSKTLLSRIPHAGCAPRLHFLLGIPPSLLVQQRTTGTTFRAEQNVQMLKCRESGEKHPRMQDYAHAHVSSHDFVHVSEESEL
jgi:hypothetical protein